MLFISNASQNVLALDFALNMLRTYFEHCFVYPETAAQKLFLIQCTENGSIFIIYFSEIPTSLMVRVKIFIPIVN